MLVVRVELHSARTGKTTEIARMAIANVGGTLERGEYHGVTFRGRGKIKRSSQPLRWAMVRDYPRQSKHVWHLVSRMLNGMGYK